jgi:hypothetical protein
MSVSDHNPVRRDSNFLRLVDKHAVENSPIAKVLSWFRNLYVFAVLIDVNISHLVACNEPGGQFNWQAREVTL